MLDHRLDYRQVLLIALSAITLVLMAVEDRAQGAPGYLDVIVVPPYLAQDWSSPKRLLRSQLRGVGAVAWGRIVAPEQHRSGYGHALVHFACESSRGPAEAWSGFTGDNDGEGARVVLRDGAGLGALLYRFENHHLQDETEVKDYLRASALVPGKHPRFLRVPIDRAQCDALTCHLRRFEARDATTTYGFTPDPMRYEGAGCTSYAASFLRAAGLFSPELRTRWTRHLEISSRYVGSRTLQAEFGLAPIDARQPRSVELYTILKPFKRSTWARDGYASYPLDLLDPALMTEHLDELMRAGAGSIARTDWGQGLELEKLETGPSELLEPEACR